MKLASKNTQEAQQNRILKILIPITPLIFFAMGISLHPEPLQINMSFSKGIYLGIFFKFLLFLTGVFFWGRIFKSLIKVKENSISVSFFLGLIFIILLTTIFRTLKLHSNEYFWIHFLILGISPGISFFIKKPVFEFSGITAAHIKTRDTLISFFVFISFLLIFLSLFFKSSLPQLQNDPLVYHLPLAKNLIEPLSNPFNIKFPLYLMASWWEYIYSWGFILTGGVGNLGLIESQIFSQWIHFFLGLALTALIIREIFLEFSININPNWVLLFLLIPFYSGELANSAIQAKNDYGSIVFIVFSLLFFLRASNQKSPLIYFFLGGISLGLACSIKVNSLFSAFPIAIAFILITLKSIKITEAIKKIAITLGGFTLFFLPFIYRNHSLSGNPVFPQFNNIFKSKWYVEFLDFSSLNNAKEIQSFIFKFFNEIYNFISDGISAILLLSGILSLFILKKESRVLKLIFISSLATVLFYAIYMSFNPYPEPRHLRYIGAGYPVFCVSSLCLLFFTIEKIKIKSEFKKVIILIFPIIFSLFSLINSQAPYKILISPSSFESVTEKTWFHFTGGKSKAWMLENIPKEKVIISDGDRLFYYLYDRKIMNITQPFLYDSYRNRTPKEIFTRLEKIGVDYIYHSGRHLWITKFSILVRNAALNYPRSIRYYDDRSMVVDLKFLNKQFRDSSEGITTKDSLIRASIRSDASL
jgi:hypothetical protein